MDNTLLTTAAVTTIILGVSGYFIYSQFMGGTSSINRAKSDIDKDPNIDSASKNGTSSNKPKEHKYPGGKLHIYFGSQTGTAEGYARTLMEEGKAAGFDAKSIDLEEFDPNQLSAAHIAIFLVATYGEGSPTDNAAKFAQWLKNEEQEVPADFLSDLQFTVFGLGNRQYEHYNRMGKITNTGLESIGGKRVFEYGEGDDDGTLEEDFDAWKSKLWPALKTKFLQQSSASEDETATTKVHPVNHEFQIVRVEGGKKSEELRSAETSNSIASNQSSTGSHRKINASTRHFFTAPRAKILVNRELRNLSYQNKDQAEEIGSTRHIEIDLSSVQLTYHTADNLAILPENLPSQVALLLKHFQYNPEETVDFQPLPDNSESEFKLIYPSPSTIQQLFTEYVDITGELKHSTLKALLYYVQDAAQRAWLSDLLDEKHRAQFKLFIEQRKPGLVDLIQSELSSLAVPLVDLLHILPPIQPRYYTISSSSLVYPQTVHITVSLSEYSLPAQSSQTSKHRFSGLTSSYLKDLRPSQQSMRVFIRPSTFRLPASLSAPVIMIGPGTGLAPMRAFLQERRHLLANNANKADDKQAVGKFELYFGCKHAEMDFIYADELQGYLQDKTLTGLHTAFSRDSAKKVYVQHLLQQTAHAEQLAKWILHDTSYIYVCGATNMGQDVHQTIVRILEEQGRLSREQAVTKVKELQEKGQYVQELWSE